MTDPVKGIEPVAPCPQARHVVEVQFLGEDDAPLSDIAVELIKSRSEVQLGRTDRRGLIRFDGLVAGSYHVSAWAIDQDAWELLRTETLAGPAAEGQGDATWSPPQVREARAAFVHPIAPGECTAKLAERYGLFPDTVWDHPENAVLKKLREDKNILFAGDAESPADRLYIPALRVKTLVAEVGQRLVLRRKGIPEILRIRFMDEDEPRSGIPYLLSLSSVDGELMQRISGRTDAAGFLIEYVPPSAGFAELVLGNGEEQEFYELDIGHLDPLATDSGLAARLDNLGYDTGEPGDNGTGLAQALADFRADRGLADESATEQVRDVVKRDYLS